MIEAIGLEELNAITLFILVIAILLFVRGVLGILRKAVESESRAPRHSIAAQLPQPPPQQLQPQLPQLPGNESRKGIVLEIEFPEKIRIPYSRLPELIRIVKGENIDHINKSNDKNLYEKIRENEEQKKTTEPQEHPHNPWINIISKISGLEFSGNGKSIYCPHHGWVSYIITEDGRILCGYDYHTLFDPNKPKQFPVEEIKKTQQELKKVMNDIQELRNISHMEIPIQKQEHQFMEKEDEEPGEDEEE